MLTEEEEKITGNVIMFVPFSMSQKELQQLYYTAYRRFYLRPKIIYRRIKKLFNPLEFKKSIRGIFILYMFLIEELKHRIKNAFLENATRADNVSPDKYRP